MVVRTCVRNAFSGTDAPSAANRLPQSSSTAGPVNPAGKLAATALGARAGDKAIRNRQATLRTYAVRLVLIKISSLTTAGRVAANLPTRVIAVSGKTGKELQSRRR